MKERTEKIRAIVDFVKEHFVDRRDQATYITLQHLEKAEQALAFQILDNKENPIESYITTMSNNHIPWPDIRQFHQVKKDVGWKAQYTGLEDDAGTPIMDRTATMPLLEFEGTVKIHGTNAAFQIHKDGSIVCQSRERIITPLQDNAGFARFIHDIPVEFWDQYKAVFPENWDVVTIFGEWAGPGIQKGVAVGDLAHKTFFIFGAKSGEGEDTEWIDVRDWKGDADKHIHNIYEFPTFKLHIDFETPELMINVMNDLTLAVEKECPVGKAFGHSGIGEGVVWRCITPGWYSSRYWFKVKGSEHSNSKVKKLASVDVAKMNSIKDFVSQVLDEERLEQGVTKLKENGVELSEKATGDYLRWIVGDIVKECQAEMEQFAITDKDVGKLVNGDARKWFFRKLQSK